MPPLALIPALPHPANWYFGWASVLAGFLTGAALGLFFHREDFWGGYASFRRRIVRLGHIAQVALGLMNVIFAISPWPIPESAAARAAGLLFILGGVSMPLICFLTAWRNRFRHLFFIPVASLIAAAILTMLGGIL